MNRRHTLRGRAATLMSARGKVLLVEDLAKGPIPEDAIVVGQYATPDHAAYFPRLAGAAFETGGIACHAAILAREFGTPCMVGVEGLLEVARTGDTIMLLPGVEEVVIDARR